MNVKRFSCIVFLQIAFFNLTIATDYYWIGNSGTWGDISHWAKTSGGIVTHNKAPTANDRVIFDENSFTESNATVTIQTDIAFAMDMDWSKVTNQPTIRAANQVVLNIYGALQLIEEMNWDFPGEVRFLAETEANAVDFSTHDVGTNIIFDGNGGWILNSAIRVADNFEIKKGILNTNNQSIDCTYFKVTTNGLKHIDFGSSKVTVNGTSEDLMYFRYPVALFQASNLTINPGTSALEFTSDSVHIAFERANGLRLGKVQLSNPNGNAAITNNSWNHHVHFAGLDLRHSTKIQGDNTIDTLSLYAGKNYLFEGNTLQKIQWIEAEGNCEEIIGLSSENNGVPLVFESNSNIELAFVAIRDIRAEGNGNLQINNGIDLGNTNGWQIDQKDALDLYWVGETGNWGNPANWAFTSGGAGGACVPTAVDNVWFDEHSFSTPKATVTIDIENAYSRNMNWVGATGSPNLTGKENNNLRIYGSLALISNMELTFAGDVFFESTQPGNTILSEGQQFKRHIRFQGVNGEWTLLDALDVYHTVFLKFGTLRTDGQKVNLGNFNGDFETPRGLFLGNSHIELLSPIARNSSRWYLNTNNLVFDAGTSTIEALEKSISFWNIGENGIKYYHLIFNDYGSTYNDLENEEPIFVQWAHFKAGGGRLEQFHFDTLQLTAAYQYIFGNEEEEKTTIDHLIANGNCDGMIFLHSDVAGDTAIVEIMKDHTLENLYLKDIQQVGSGQLIANNSSDGGNVIGWEINAATPRNLYWVGGTGFWDESEHWSLASGGTAGACPPTPIDNVFFDNNSSNGTRFSVFTRFLGRMYCHDFTVENVPLDTDIRVWTIKSFGSLRLQDGLWTELDFIMYSNDSIETIESNGYTIDYFSIQGNAQFELLDSLSLSGSFYQTDGGFHTNGFSVRARRMEFSWLAKDLEVDISDSYITLFGERRQYFENWEMNTHPDEVRLNAIGSTIEFTHQSAEMYSRAPLIYNNILFSNSNGIGRMTKWNKGQFNKVVFNGDGIIKGVIETDSLIFSAGKTYELEAQKIQKVDQYFQTIGNNCTPIEIKSSQSGTQSIIEVAEEGEIIADFVQMQDQRGQGGADLLAGRNSTNIGNSNTGWIFDSAPTLKEVGFLGKDRVLCSGNEIELSANNFSIGETYLWQDNSTIGTFQVRQPGTYYARVTFRNNCTIRDTVEIFNPEELVIELPADTSLCADTQLPVDASSTIPNVNYLWHDALEQPDRIIEEAGIYKITLERDGCTNTDSFQVSIIENPEVDLEADRFLCEGETLSLNVAQDNVAYLWQDGSTAENFLVENTGSYHVSLQRAHCITSDTLNISYINTSFLNMGADTTLCAGETLLLDATTPDATYVWQNGTEDSSFEVANSGQYHVTLSLSGCQAKDTIEVAYINFPNLDLPSTIEACEGETILLQASTLAESYIWNDSISQENLEVFTSDTYHLTVANGRCAERDSILVHFFPIPIFDLGQDTSLCEGENLLLNTTYQNGSYDWQDGSNNKEFLVTTEGQYILLLAVNNCVYEDSINVSYRPTPYVDLSETATTFCEKDSLLLEGKVAQTANLLWNTGARDAEIQIQQAGNYWLEAELDNCTHRDSIWVEAIPLPSINLGEDFTQCANESTPLDITQPNANYLWQDGSDNASFEVKNEGIYWATINVNGCSATDTVNVSIAPAPSVDLGDDQLVCEADIVRLSIPESEAIPLWNDGRIAFENEITTKGNYWLELDLNGCTERDSIFVDFIPIPTIDLGDDLELCDNETAQITANLSQGNIQWFNGETTSNIELSESQTVWAEVNDRGCIGDDSITLTFRECNFFKAYIPNVFSPNNDGVNDFFSLNFDKDIEILAYTLKVFNRWGNMVFTSSDLNINWDGTYRGKELEQGAYLYFIEVDFEDDNGKGREIFKGDVSLIR